MSKDIKLSNVEIYTDGACRGNPGPGGWACILINRETGNYKELSGGEQHTTNNRMEIMAVIKGLSALKRPCNVIIYSDSMYVINTITAGWSRNKNTDLWPILDELIAKHFVKFQWVKGHSDDALNNRCDKLARAEAAKFNRGAILSTYQEGIV